MPPSDQTAAKRQNHLDGARKLGLGEVFLGLVGAPDVAGAADHRSHTGLLEQSRLGAIGHRLQRCVPRDCGAQRRQRMVGIERQSRVAGQPLRRDARNLEQRRQDVAA